VVALTVKVNVWSTVRVLPGIVRTHALGLERKFRILLNAWGSYGNSGHEGSVERHDQLHEIGALELGSYELDAVD